MVQARTPTRESVAEILAELVSIESVNPNFPGGERGESGVAAFVTDFCARHSMDVRHQSVLPGRENVIAELRVPGAARTLLLD